MMDTIEMTTSKAPLEKRRLPDGMEIEFSMNPDTWPKIGQTAFVPRHAVTPDPNQPRGTADITETDEHKSFAESIKTHGQGMIMRVRPLTEGELYDLRDTYPLARYMIIDGERRYWACGPDGADIDYLEITVRKNKESKNIFLDQVVLNNLQQQLDIPELARALARIKNDHPEWSIAELARQVSMNYSLVGNLLTIATLPDDLLKLTSREKYPDSKKRLAVLPAVALAKVQSEASDVPNDEWRRTVYRSARSQGLSNASTLVAYFEEHHSSEDQRSRERREPRRVREKLRTALHGIVQSRVISSDSGELGRITATATIDEIAKLVSLALMAKGRCESIAYDLEQILKLRTSGAVKADAEDCVESPEEGEKQSEKSNVTPDDATELGDEAEEVEKVSEGEGVVLTHPAIRGGVWGNETPAPKPEVPSDGISTASAPAHETAQQDDAEEPDVPQERLPTGRAVPLTDVLKRLQARAPKPSQAPETNQQQVAKTKQPLRSEGNRPAVSQVVVSETKPESDEPEEEDDLLARKPLWFSVWDDGVRRYVSKEITDHTVAQDYYDQGRFPWQNTDDEPPNWWVKWAKEGKVRN